MATVTCPHCDAAVADGGAVFCPTCAQPLAERPPEPPPAPSEAPAERDAPPPPSPMPAHGPRDAAAAVGLLFPWGFHQFAADDSVIVGREHPPFAAQLAAYTNISRGHARIESRDGALFVVDLGSLNGTHVDGRRLAPDVAERLSGGQELRFGATLTATVVGPGGERQ